MRRAFCFFAQLGQVLGALAHAVAAVLAGRIGRGCDGR